MSLCPVCNGLITLQQTCPQCSQALLQDQGKLSDYYAPYSPYREIEHSKLTNGYSDAEQQQCIHYTLCPSCHTEQIVSIPESYLG